MIAHAGLYVRNYAKAKKFYTQMLKPLGYKVKADYKQWKVFGMGDAKGTDFWVNQPKKFVRNHIAFAARNRKAVHDFHAAGVRAGGKDNGKPGFRTEYSPNYFAAFITDPDGNNIEALYFGAKAPKMKKR